MKFVLKIIAAREIGKMFTSLRDKMSGWKTYVTLWVPVVYGAITMAAGGFDVGAQHVPAMDTHTFTELLFAALAGTFMRNGIAKAQGAAEDAHAASVVAAVNTAATHAVVVESAPAAAIADADTVIVNVTQQGASQPKS